MLAAHDPTLLEKKLVFFYYLFCFNVNDPSEYICLPPPLENLYQNYHSLVFQIDIVPI